MAEAIAAVAAGANVLTSLAHVRTALRDPTAEKILKSKNFKEIYASLEKEMRTLISTRDDFNSEVQTNRVTKMPSNRYVNWIREELEREVEVIKREYETCIKKLQILNPLSRRGLSRKMKTKYIEAHNLLDDANRLEVFLVEKEPESDVKQIAPDIKAFPALQGPLERILDLLTKPKVTGIRIHEAVGIGKTTVMQNLNNNVKVAEMFQIVIWVKVSTEGNTENLSTELLQQNIVRRLKLDMERINHVEDVADRIRVELEGKRYLLLLDDVKRNLDLRGIGILGRRLLRASTNRYDVKSFYKSLSFCCEYLDDDCQKNCFYYSALYPEDSNIYIVLENIGFDLYFLQQNINNIKRLNVVK
ncbi:hypothetical protein RJ639_023699 [Escallonia herrerae]|uniref:NB-ARC domain-containing protein n=1 Tax=Escallonia herrerae TaxID=1293975 RepID=A0AA89AFC6_9ASTE|nr:hypothetical protein RJ639_023699 [Escallonia herrerae]